MPVGASVRFEPGVEREAELVPVRPVLERLRRADGQRTELSGEFQPTAGTDRDRHAELFGPATGDRIRPADPDLLIEVTEDRSIGPAGWGDEVLSGGGEVIHESMGRA